MAETEHRLPDVPPSAAASETVPSRSPVLSMGRGALFRCPCCGKGALYRAYLKVNDLCPVCGEAMHHQRADDAPPYMTIFAVGHVMIPLVLGVDMLYAWPMWLNVAVWFPLIIGLALIVLPITKGALVGLQWALRMHGFGGSPDDGAAGEALPRRAFRPPDLGRPKQVCVGYPTKTCRSWHDNEADSRGPVRESLLSGRVRQSTSGCVGTALPSHPVERARESKSDYVSDSMT